jgi:hypothetical protein
VQAVELRATDHPDAATGVLWIRQCKITNVGAHVTFHVTGNGWRWVDQTRSTAGGTFTVWAHVVTLWFTPDRRPAVEFAWERPTSEIAHSTGGPMVACPATP